MSDTNIPCKRCLLEEASLWEASNAIKRYIERVDEDILAPKKEYEYRLRLCKECSNLISGTCVKCGCFVEMRAAIINNQCPDVPSRW